MLQPLSKKSQYNEVYISITFQSINHVTHILWPVSVITMRQQFKHLIIESKLDYIESNLQFKDLTFKAIVPKLDYIDSKLEYYDLSL